MQLVIETSTAKLGTQPNPDPHVYMSVIFPGASKRVSHQHVYVSVTLAVGTYTAYSQGSKVF